MRGFFELKMTGAGALVMLGTGIPSVIQERSGEKAGLKAATEWMEDLPEFRQVAVGDVVSTENRLRVGFENQVGTYCASLIGPLTTVDQLPEDGECAVEGAAREEIGALIIDRQSAENQLTQLNYAEQSIEQLREDVEGHWLRDTVSSGETIVDFSFSNERIQPIDTGPEPSLISLRSVSWLGTAFTALGLGLLADTAVHRHGNRHSQKNRPGLIQPRARR